GTRSPRSGSAAPTGIPRLELLKLQSCAKSRCRTSVAKHRPQLTNAARPATFEVEAYNERGEMVPTAIAGEHPLTLYVDKRETVYKQAGAVHGCALATAAGEILMFVEDVGRHNAVDAIAGFMWLDGIDGSDKLFYTTGRLTSEMVIKCAQMRIPFLVSRSGLTQMGHAIASQVGITMLGRASGKHYLAFTGKERLVKTATQRTEV